MAETASRTTGSAKVRSTVKGSTPDQLPHQAVQSAGREVDIAISRSNLKRMKETWRAYKAGKIPFSHLHDDDPVKRIMVVRYGLPAKAVGKMAFQLGVTKEAAYDYLGINRATATRLAKSDKPLTTAATERALFIAGLARTIEDEIPKDKEPFDAPRWVAQWLDTPQPALNGHTAASYLDTADGRHMVRRLLGQLLTGTYA